MDELLKELKATRPKNNCYSSKLEPGYENTLKKAITDELSNCKITGVDAPKVLRTIWKHANGFTLLKRDDFTTLGQCKAYVKQNPDIRPLLAEVCKRKAYTWLCENLPKDERHQLDNLFTPVPIEEPINSLDSSLYPIGEPTDSLYPTGEPMTSLYPIEESIDFSYSIGEPITSLYPMGEAKGIIGSAICDLEGLLRKYFKDNPQLPSWQPERRSKSHKIRTHIANLNIPKILLNSPSPSLLLHKLGGDSHDPKLVNRLNNLFHLAPRLRFLCNTSGSGKTRLLFEGLWRNWGFYFTANTQPDFIGSLDLENILEQLEQKARLTRVTDKNRAMALDANEEVTSRRFLLLICVRMLVFRIFLDCASKQPGGITDDHKGRWLLLQVAPAVLLEKEGDIFLNYFQRLELLPLQTMKKFVKEELEKVRKHIGRTANPFCVLDEAQVSMHKFQEYFRSDLQKEESRPILRPIILSWRAVCPNLIVSGTGVSMQELEAVLASAVAKESNIQSLTHTDLGAFDDEKAQYAYLEQYLPQALWILNTGKQWHIAWDIGYMVGVHRFTATYLSRLIQNNFESPHRVLNDTVDDIAHFKPSDFDVEDEPPVTYVDYEASPFYGIDFSKLNKDEALHRQIAGFVFDYVFHGKPRGTGGHTYAKLVEYGVARFGNHKNILVDEPLALLAAMHYFTNDTPWSLQYFLKEGLTNSNESARGTSFEYFCAYLLAIAFKSVRPLSEVFTFFGQHSSSLENEEGELVAVEKINGVSVCQPVDISSNVGPTYRQGCTPGTQKKTLAWLQNPQKTVFCFPVHTMGPDLILVLKLSDQKIVRVLVQFKQKMEETMSRTNIEKAFRTTDPNHFLSKKHNAPFTAQSANSALQSRNKSQLQEALRSLGPSTTKAGDFGVLRVLMTYPAIPDTAILTELANADTGSHPAATVDLESLASDIIGQETLNWLSLKVQGVALERKRKREVESDDDDDDEVPKAKRTRTAKGKTAKK